MKNKLNSVSSPAKVVLITGSSSGIGRSTAIEFARNGWQVIASMRSPEHELELGHQPNISLLKLDVTDAASIASAIEVIESKFGRIDVLVNNAGYGLMGAFEETDDEQIRRQFDTNVFGLMKLTRAVLPLMRRAGQGRIINISSIGGKIGIPLYSSYHATKFAIEGFSESLSFELAPFGIDVALIEPGAIATEFLGRSADFAKREGESPYQKYFERVNLAYGKAAAGGSKPTVVARKIVKVAGQKRPKFRNPVGGGAEILMGLRKLLPDCAIRGLVSQQTSG
jgi:NAD(P)-dependent dehydrogenase (short-subunit alcohol dehydrogenase family)